MYRRNIKPYVRDALADTLVVLFNGARQTGKTTLALKLVSELPLRYVTLDDATILPLLLRTRRALSAGWDKRSLSIKFRRSRLCFLRSN